MGRRRIEAERLRELVRLRRLGASARRTARLLRMGPNTERWYRRVLVRAGLLEGPPDRLPSLDEVRAAVNAAAPALPPKRPSLDAWRPQLEALLDKGLTARAAFDRLRLETSDATQPFRGSYSGVKRVFRQLRRARGRRQDDVVIAVDTSPGDVAQVDFGYAGKLFDPATGVLRRAWCFVMVLGHSRLMFVRLVFDQRVETWIRLHEEAFAAFGGCVATVVPDNCRRAVLRAAFGIDGACELNRSYRELAHHYGFTIDPAPPRSPRKKGKVEAAVRYVRNNPLKGREGEPMDLVQAALLRWNREIASTRVHGTTRRRPIDVFEMEERAALRPLPPAPYDVAVWKKARVHPDSHVAFRDKLFSVPWQLVSESVWIRATEHRLEVFHDDHSVASHERTAAWRTTDEAHLPADRRELRHRGRSLWEERAARVGPETLALVRAIFGSEDVLSRLRQVQAVVTHLERHPRLRAEATARRALAIEDHTYQGVKRSLAFGLDLLTPPQPDGSLMRSDQRIVG